MRRPYPTPLPAAGQHRTVSLGRALRSGLAVRDGHPGRPGSAPAPRPAHLSRRALCRRLRGHGQRHPTTRRGDTRADHSCPGLRRAAPIGGEDHDCSPRRGVRVPRLPHPAADQTGLAPPIRLHLGRETVTELDQDQGQNDHQTRHEQPAEGPAAPAQPSAARLDQLLPARGGQADIQLPPGLHLAARHRMAAAQVPPHQLEADPPPPRRMVAPGRRHGTVRHPNRARHPLPLPRRGHPHTLDPTTGDHAGRLTLASPRGEPDAVEVARPVRGAGRGNGPAETLDTAPRSDSTTRSATSCLTPSPCWTPSTSSTPSPCWTPSTSSSSPARLDEVRRRVQQQPCTGVASRTTGCTRSAAPFSPATSIPPTGDANGSTSTCRSVTPMARLRSPGASINRSASTTPGASPRAASSPRSSSTRSTPARSPRSSDSARLCAAGARRSWPTSQPAASATAGQKRSTASSRRPGGGPTASELHQLPHPDPARRRRLTPLPTPTTDHVRTMLIWEGPDWPAVRRRHEQRASVGQTNWMTGATAPAQHQSDGSTSCPVSAGVVAEGHCGTTG